MKLLQRYVLTKFLACYLISITGLIGIFLVVDFFERVDEFISHDAPMSYLFMYYLYKIPFFGSYMGPQACLLSTVITLAILSRHNEFVAMKACGIGVTGITLPLVGASLIISFLILASNEFIAPKTTTEMNQIFYVKVRGKTWYGKTRPNWNIDMWHRSQDGTIWSIDNYDPKKNIMKGVRIFFGTENSFIRKRVDAAQAVWDGKQWEFQEGYIRAFKKDRLDTTEYFEKTSLPILERPSDFEKVRIKSEELSAREMYESIKLHVLEGKDMTRHWVEFHQKISYPFIGIVLTLLAIPLSLRSSRQGGILFCVAVNLAMGFAFSFLYTVGISLGYGGTFGPVLAAWGPNIFFTSVGFYLILTLDSERILPI